MQTAIQEVKNLQALIIRDLMMRFGRHHLGFVWTVLEPMILCAGVMIVWSLIKEPLVHGIPIITFVLTGYMPVTLWRHMTNPMIQILRGNASLLYHHSVSHVQVMLARSLLEFMSTSVALAVIYFVLLSAGLIKPISDPGLAMAAWLFTAWYYGAMGLLLGACTEYWEPAEKFIQPMQYLALPLSGMFFMVDWLPLSAQRLLLWNPAIHCFEMFRAGFLGPEISTHFDPFYLASCSFGLTIFGAAAVHHVRDHIQIN